MIVAGGVELQPTRESVPNIADLVNKVGFDLAAVFAVKAMSESEAKPASVQVTK